MSSKLPVVIELESAFQHVNQNLFSGSLRMPTFALQVEKKVVLKFVPGSFVLLVGQRFFKANLQQVHESLLHEMVHVSNYLAEVPDCTSNQYHNKAFLGAALEAGFFVSRNKSQGWGLTSFRNDGNAKSPSQSSLDLRKTAFENISFTQEKFSRFKKELSHLIPKNSDRKVYFLKYVCGCEPPHNSIRSGRRPDGDHPISAICLDCNQPYVLVDGQI
jgi:hypothetical protein